MKSRNANGKSFFLVAADVVFSVCANLTFVTCTNYRWSRFSSTCSDGTYESLNLRDNALVGELPLEIGLLSDLGWIELEDNPGLYGTMPSSWGEELPKLYFLSLRNASLTGSVPTTLGLLTDLKELDLSSNKLTGSLPEEILGFESIRKLGFSNNSLTGPLPRFGPNMKNLTALYLDNNKFTATIPTTFGLLTNLKVLQLNGNDLSGAVPFEVCRMKAEGNLEQINIDCEKVECTLCECTCGATEDTVERGTLFAVAPSEEANQQTFEEFQQDSLPEYSQDATVNSPQASALFWLGADYNFESYTVDQRLQRFSLASLYYALGGENWNDNTHWLSYDLSDCEWYSSLEDESICNDFGLMTSLALADNNLYGPLPEELGVLSRLTELNLSGNNLRDGLPTTVGLLTEMMYMELDSTSLSGSIPTQVGTMTQMSGEKLLTSY